MYNILYVTTNLMQQDTYGGYSPFWSDHRFVKNQEKLLKSLVQCGSVTVSLPVSWGYRLPPWVDDWKDKVVINTNRKKVNRLIKKSDLVVFDWASTTMFYALKINKPLFVLESFEMIPEARTLFQCNALMYKTVNELISGVKGHLNRGIDISAFKTDDFMNAYCSYDEAVKKAVKEVISIGESRSKN